MKKPIAVVDSGVGGLACLGAVRRAMPNEDIIYFGDTANMPYGTRSVEELTSFADRFGRFFAGQGAKMMILACGTMSSTVIPFLYREYPEILIQGVIDPAVAACSRMSTDENRIGVIATPRSIESGSYQSAFKSLRKKPAVFFRSCPELSVYIEKGITQGKEMEELLHSYLDELVYEDKIDTLLLGCTHYPLVTDCIEKLYPGLRTVDPAAALAKSASMLLKVHGMCSEKEEIGSLRILASKKTAGFASMAELLGMGDVEIEEVDI